MRYRAVLIVLGLAAMLALPAWDATAIEASRGATTEPTQRLACTPAEKKRHQVALTAYRKQVKDFDPSPLKWFDGRRIWLDM